MKKIICFTWFYTNLTSALKKTYSILKLKEKYCSSVSYSKQKFDMVEIRMIN